jgi:hypothetical protein
MIKSILYTVFLILPCRMLAQVSPDSIKTKRLDEVIIKGERHSLAVECQQCDKQYFTKRPQFYPGSAVWSSDGRSVVVTIGFNI